MILQHREISFAHSHFTRKCSFELVSCFKEMQQIILAIFINYILING